MSGSIATRNTTSMHGSCVVVDDVGCLILGPSRSGKTELAFELVRRGHRFVADDVVCLAALPDGRMLAMPSPEIGALAHVRDIGLVHVAALFGADRVAASVPLAAVIELTTPAEDAAVVLGDENATYTPLEIPLPYYRIQRIPGRNLALLLEIVARTVKLKKAGLCPAAEFLSRGTKPTSS